MIKKWIFTLVFFSILINNANGENVINIPNSDIQIKFLKSNNLDNDILYQISKDGENFSKPQIQLRTIHLRAGVFDPLDPDDSFINTINNKPSTLKANATCKTFIIQFKTKTLPIYKKNLSEMGVTVCKYLPNQSFIVKMNPESFDKVRLLSFVRWVGHYHPVYKVDQVLQLKIENLSGKNGLDINQINEIKRYVIMLIEREEETKRKVADAISNIGGTIIANLKKSYRIDANLSLRHLAEVVKIDEIAFIELWGPIENDMDNAREIGGANYIEDVPLGYTGNGVRAEVMDGGLMVTHNDFQNRQPIIHGGNNDDPLFQWHGTHTYGIVFGDGTSDITGRGMLPDAQGIFSYYKYNNGTVFDDRTAHIAELVDPIGNFRAVFHSCSWGHPVTTEYTNISINLDQILFDFDILALNSQSNAGNQMSRPEAWCKNIVSVGAINHYNTLDKADDVWYDPTNGGASIGPAADGRIKPDFCHFYDFTWSTDNADDDVYSDFGGTSGATPITAGHFGLMFEMWADGVFNGARGDNRDVFESRPHMSTAKAILINTAAQYPFSGTTHDLTRVHQGWGMADVQNLYTRSENNNWHFPILVNESRILEDGEIATFNLRVHTSGNWLRATLVYSDPPPVAGASIALVNDLSIRVVSPSSTEYFGNVGLDEGNWSTSGGFWNTIDNVENVFIENADAGLWLIAVSAHAINEDGHIETPEDDADFALVVTTGGNSTCENEKLHFKCENRERMRINDNGDILISGIHSTSPFEGLKFSYLGSDKASLNEEVGNFTSIPSNPPTTVDPLPPEGINFRNMINGNTFQISSDGLLRANRDAKMFIHTF